MPIYEYECGSCGHRLEAIQKMSESVLKDCPACGKSALRKQISASGFQLKGSGWYVTDFKGGGKKEKSESSDAKSSDTKDSTPPKKKASGGYGGGGCGCAH
ncbi:MAG: zinc ribbon domain-containing protein [Sulfuricaulis sp.]|nr:zinc ribbon domain-containing protein [Sulfuricaulis sp.]